MSKEQTTNALLSVVAARQREMLAAEEALEAKTIERIRRRHMAFNETGIPELWTAVKSINVLHPNTDFLYLQVPLQRWIRPIYVNDLIVGLKAREVTWRLDAFIEWKTIVQEDGKTGYRSRRANSTTQNYNTAKELKAAFVEWLADIIPVEELAGLEISDLETPNVRRRVIKKITHANAN